MSTTMNPKIYMLVGLPASGKTTKAREMCEESDHEIRRVNRDELREMFDGSGEYSPDLEKLVRSANQILIKLALAHGYDVVVDNTNLKPQDKIELEFVAFEEGADLIEILMEVDVEECVRRDRGRERCVGEAVIRKMYDTYLKK
jgi:predicted kinase